MNIKTTQRTWFSRLLKISFSAACVCAMDGAIKILHCQVHDFASEQKSRLLRCGLKKGRRAFFQQPVNSLAFAVAFLPIALPVFAQDAPFTTELADIQHSWDQANYQSANAEDKQRQLEALTARSEALARKYPKHAEPLVWEGIVLSSYAGAKGGLGALSLAKKSRDCLLEASRIDPAALRGSAYTSLGALYSKVPGWPIGFGDQDKATDFLRKALAINPDGIDPNYFIGELLYEQGDYSQSLQHLQKALAAPPRPDRPIADIGRRAEIDTLMAKVRTRLR